MANKNLRRFVSQYLKKDTDIAATSEVMEILNIQDTKAREFIDLYSHKFSVNISNFDYNRYLNPDSPDYYPLTIGDLEQGVTTRYLDSSIIEAEHNDINIPTKQPARSVIIAVVTCIIIAAMLAIIAYYV